MYSTAVLVAQSPLPMLPAKFLLQHVQQQQGAHRITIIRSNSTPLIFSDTSIAALAATADADEDEDAGAEASSERSAAASRGGKKTRGQ